MLKQPPRLSEFAPLISVEVEKAVAAAMAKEAEQRPTSSEFAITLRGLLEKGNLVQTRG